MTYYFVIDRATGTIVAAKPTIGEARTFSRADDKGHPLTFITGPMTYDAAADLLKGYNRAAKLTLEKTP